MVVFKISSVDLFSKVCETYFLKEKGDLKASFVLLNLLSLKKEQLNLIENLKGFDKLGTNVSKTTQIEYITTTTFVCDVKF